MHFITSTKRSGKYNQQGKENSRANWVNQKSTMPFIQHIQIPESCGQGCCHVGVYSQLFSWTGQRHVALLGQPMEKAVSFHTPVTKYLTQQPPQEAFIWTYGFRSSCHCFLARQWEHEEEISHPLQDRKQRWREKRDQGLGMTFKGTPPVTYFLHKIPPNKVSRISQKRLWRIFHFEAIAKSLCTRPPLQEQLAW